MGNIKYNKLHSNVKHFLQSNYFLLLCAALSFAFWVFNLTEIGLGTLLFIFCLVLIFFKDTTYSLPPLIFIYFIFNNYTTLGGNESLIFFAALPIAGIIVHMIRFRPRFRIRGFGWAVLLTTFPWLLGGVTRRGIFNIEYVVVAGYGLLVLFLYLFYDATTEGKDNKLAIYLCKILLVSAIIVTLEVGVFFAKYATQNGLDVLIKKLSSGAKLIKLGWGCSNNVAAYLSLTFPITMYFGLKNKKYALLSFGFALLQYGVILLTFSRGPILFCSVGVIGLLGYSIIKSKSRLKVLTVTLVFLAIGIAGIIYFRSEVDNLLKVMLKRGLDDHGRAGHYVVGWQTFKKYPVFGGGMDIYYSNTQKFDVYGARVGIIYFFHSTFWQIAATMGLLGLRVYAFHFYLRYKTVLKKHEHINLMICAGMLLFELYGFVDTHFFSPLSYIIIAILTMAVEKGYKKSDRIAPVKDFRIVLDNNFKE